MGGAAAAPAPAADPMAGLEGLLGGMGAAAAPAPAPAADPMAALLGGASLGGGDTGDLLSKLLGGGMWTAFSKNQNLSMDFSSIDT